MHDINSNGTIDIEDFLSVFGLFEMSLLTLMVYGTAKMVAFDIEACNYYLEPLRESASIQMY